MHCPVYNVHVSSTFIDCDILMRDLNHRNLCGQEKMAHQRKKMRRSSASQRSANGWMDGWMHRIVECYCRCLHFTHDLFVLI